MEGPINIFERRNIMLFKKKFVIVEIHKSGVKITHHINGSKQNIESAIEQYKKRANDYVMVGMNGMVVWV